CCCWRSTRSSCSRSCFSHPGDNLTRPKAPKPLQDGSLDLMARTVQSRYPEVGTLSKGSHARNKDRVNRISVCGAIGRAIGYTQGLRGYSAAAAVFHTQG